MPFPRPPPDPVNLNPGHLRNRREFCGACNRFGPPFTGTRLSFSLNRETSHESTEQTDHRGGRHTGVTL